MENVTSSSQPRDFQKWLRDPNRLMWLLSAFLVLWHLAPLFSTQQLAGWDLTSHYYLSTRMLGYLQAGKVIGYDWSWYGGYPAFALYPPFFYIFSLLPYFFSIGSIPIALSFNLSLVVISFALLFSFHFCARAWLAARAGPAALLFGLLFLTLPSFLAHFSVGLLGLVAIGLPASYLAMAIAALVLGMLEKYFRAHASIFVILGTGTLIAACILTHVIFTLFLMWTLFCFFLFRKDCNRVALACASLVGILLSAWWWSTFLQSLPFSSGVTLGLPQWMADPLLVLFPGLRDIHPAALFTARFRFLHFWLTQGSSPISIALPVFLLDFPYHAVLFGICTIAGITNLIKVGKFFLPLFYLASLLLLPRNFLTETFSGGLHTYRFIQPLFILQVILSASGLIAILNYLAAVPALAWRRVLPRLAKCFCGCALLFGSFLSFSLQPSSYQVSDTFRPGDVIYSAALSDYPDNRDAERVFDYLRKSETNGRIATDVSESLFQALGSPHFFTSQIPLRLKLPVLSGLLAESALSAGFINPTMSALAQPGHRALVWGSANLANSESFLALPVDSLVRRLQLFGTGYVLSALPETKQSLDSSYIARRVFESGPFTVYKLPNPQALVTETEISPFLFIDHDGMSFRQFAELWYSQDGLLDRPVIYAPKGESSIPPEEQSRIPGYIVSWNRRKPISQEQYDFWAAKGKPVLILNAVPADIETHSDRVHFVFDTQSPLGPTQLSEILGKLAPPTRTVAISFNSPDADSLTTSSSKALFIDLSYSPLWKSIHASQSVYWATPSKIFMFGRGENSIRFK